MRRIVAVAAVVGALSLTARGWQAPAGIFPRVDPVIDSLWAGFDMPQAQQHVEFIARHWRLPGNPGYEASLDRIHARLTGAGFTPLKTAVAGATAARLLIDEYPNSESGGWDHTVGTLALVRSSSTPREDEVVLSREKDRLALCINSFSTPADGVLAPLYDVGRGDRDEDYAGKNLKGAVVLGDADLGQLWRRAVTAGGAIGVISTSLPRYISPDPPGAKPTPRDQWDILQWGSIPYDATRKGFGFKASPRAAARLRRAIASSEQIKPGEDQTRPSDHVMVRVTIQSSFSTKPNRTLIAEIPGRVAPGERVILAAHVQEPGANDNASGVATLAELAVALEAGIRAGKIPPPGRTLTFLFLNEIGGSRRWLQAHAADAKNVRYMISMDMTGEDVAKTGGSFLVERWPDPNAVWDRPWDPHSEWGRGNVKAEQLKGDLINDAHLAVCERVARKSGWVVKTNPYEGGSDHTVFGSAGVPSLLDWHFTDRYYHTNFDTPDKTSSAEMRNVGVCAAATAWLFGSSDGTLALSVAELVANAGKARVALEEREGAKLAAADKDPAAAKTREAQIVTAWRKWYAEAVRSVSRLVVGPPAADFASKVEALAKPFDGAPAPREIAPAFESRVGGPMVESAPVPPESTADAQQRAGEPLSDARILICGTDMTLPAPIPVRWDTVVLAGDSRGFAPCQGRHDEEHREFREQAVLMSALASRTPREPAIRRAAVAAFGRMGVWTRSKQFTALLPDLDADLRKVAVEAITESLVQRAGERPVAGEVFEKHFSEATTALRARLRIEKDDEVAGAILASLGRLRYPHDAARDEVETFLANAATFKSPSARILGVTKGLESLIRANPKRAVKLETREKLRLLATTGPTSAPVPTVGDVGTAEAPGELHDLARSRRLALTALQTARDDDFETIRVAANDADWQVRRLVALRLDATRSDLDKTVDLLAADPVFQVRYEMTNVFARAATRSGDCARLVPYLADPEPTVLLRAIDLLPSACGKDDAVIEPLVKWAEQLNTPLDARTWHAPAHALEALARINPDAGRPHLGRGAAHQIWQVRARAAAASEAFKDGDTAARLARDPEPNVRTAAIDTLVGLQHPARFDAALEALKLDDFQLIRTAALALRGAPEAGRDNVVNQLVDTLRRLTDAAADTSRDPRVAILERLGELLPLERTADLGLYREDFDPRVREAARTALAKLINAQVEPSRVIKYRYPYQPSMKLVPSLATITMDGGAVIELELLRQEAPVTVARFAELAQAGFYNGLTFHRVVPNFVIQGGSPGANEYAGVARYMRDEVGLEHHTRGAVGISTRGPDTGDAQIFIDLVDIPRLDHQYTVFARVVAGLDVVDRILEGARIRSITVK